MKKQTITVEGAKIRLYSRNDHDYICITDMARKFNDRTDVIIQRWLRNSSTVDFLELWEKLYNPNFNPIHLGGIRENISRNSFILSVKQWISMTNAIGLESRAGRYGGTYAHKDIAYEFGSWLSPAFKLYMIIEFQRLKTEEAKRLETGWDVKRLLTKANFHIHRESVRENLVPVIDWNTKREAIYHASEIDLLNLALFGMTAKEWRIANPNKKGNIRDHASSMQLLILANLQSLNAKLLQWDCDREQRIQILNETAREQMAILLNQKAIEDLKKLEGKKK